MKKQSVLPAEENIGRSDACELRYRRGSNGAGKGLVQDGEALVKGGSAQQEAWLCRSPHNSIASAHLKACLLDLLGSCLCLSRQDTIQHPYTVPGTRWTLAYTCETRNIPEHVFLAAWEAL
eukprot:1146063-Pelagomonas_calceolata.AAC.2